MLGLATGSVFRDVQVRISKTGRKFARATIRENTKELLFFTVFADAGTPAFDTLTRAERGEALSIKGSLKLTTFEKDGVVKPSVDLMADTIIPATQMDAQEKR